MRVLASPRGRLFFVVWLLYSAHFATNVVREHYPAFTLADRLSLKVDEYQGFHSDIFQHGDGHWYVNSNVAVSVLAAVPLFVFDPVLDALERYDKGGRGATLTDSTYRTDKPNRRAFWTLVHDRGLALRFGGATAVTSLFLMAPLSALAVVLMYHALVLRGVPDPRANGLALLFAFGTPMFYRTAPLNPNMFLTYAAFTAFLLLWVRPGTVSPVSWMRRLAGGLLGGFALAADYSGLVILVGLYGYLLVSRLASADWRTSFRESLVFVAGVVPPLLLLLYSQWVMFGNPLFPAQYWMPAVRYSGHGWRGMDWPAPDLFLRNLFDPSYGMYAYGPLLVLGLLPTRRYAPADLILQRPERRWVAAFIVAFLIFCAANQYSRMQFNTGFRYLAPLVPFVFLQAADHLARMPRKLVYSLAAVTVLHSWVIAAVREPVPLSWRLFVTEGIQLPWLTVMRKTMAPDTPLIGSPFLPIAILGMSLLLAWAIWRYGARQAARRASPPPAAPVPAR